MRDPHVNHRRKRWLQAAVVSMAFFWARSLRRLAAQCEKNLDSAAQERLALR
jgi:hypothetical protein